MFRASISRLAAVLGLMWFGYGCWCYALLQIRCASFVLPLPAQAMEAVDALPYWVTALWGIELGLGVVGSLLMLLRWRRADWAFADSAAAGMVSLGARVQAGAMPEGPVIPVVSIILAAALLLYARLLTRAPSGG